jgi:hypothetical protein
VEMQVVAWEKAHTSGGVKPVIVIPILHPQ